MLSIFSMAVSPLDIICLDAEFTDLNSPELLSLGMASGTGAEHYAELDLQHPDNAGVLRQCSDFTRYGCVLEQFGLVTGSASHLADMARRTADWLTVEVQNIRASSGQPAFIAFDIPTDFELLVRLLQRDERWPHLASQIHPMDVSELTCRLDAAIAADTAFEALRRNRRLSRHHALADAWALRAAVHAGLTGRRLPL